MNRFFKTVYKNSSFKKLLILLSLLFTVIVTLDSNDYLSGIVKKYNVNPTSIFTIVFGVCVIICVVFSSIGIIKSLKSKLTTDVDAFISILLIWLVFYESVSLLFLKSHLYKHIVLISLIIGSIIILVYRIFKTQPDKTSALPTGKLYDMIDIYEGKDLNHLPILVHEKDVDYDLFGRECTIQHLYNSIISCLNIDTSFVIGLVGPWGSGKTTIINNLQLIIKNNQDDNSMILCDFDPWIYESQEALLTSMLDAILNSVGLNSRYSSAKSMVNSVARTILGEHVVGKIANDILSNSLYNEDLNSIKCLINEHLSIYDKTLVVFIDNVDRASSDNIIFLFKIISTILDLNRVVYVLSYDRERIDRILEKSLEIDKHYLEKIVQQEIRVPKLGGDKFENVISISIKNVLTAYGVTDVKQFNFITDFLYQYISDIRMFKRLINSAFSIAFSDTNLYKPDLLALEIICFLDNELYDTIKDNYIYFVSFDMQYDYNAARATVRKDQYYKDRKAFFEKLESSHNAELIKLLANVFPNIESFINNRDSFFGDSENSSMYKSASLQSRASSTKFFDLYFSYNNNGFLGVSKFYSIFYDQIEQIDLSLIPKTVEECFQKLPKEYHREFFEKMWFNQKDFEKQRNYPLLLGLKSIILHVDTESEFLRSSPYIRATSIMATLFSMISAEQKKLFIESVSKDYRYLYTLYQMSSWLEDQDKDSLEIINKALEKMFRAISNNTINLYDDSFYIRNNIWAFVWVKKRLFGLDDSVEIRDYINKVFNYEIVYRILSDLITYSIGTYGYSYFIDSKSMKVFFSDNELIEKAIELFPPSNKKEQFIYRVYLEYKNGAPGILGRKEIIEKNPVDFDLND